MARPSQPWWWERRRSYYVIVGGERHRLGADRAAAHAEWLRLLRDRGDDATGDVETGDVDRSSQPAAHTLAHAVDAYMAALPGWAQPATVRTSRRFFAALLPAVGAARPLADVTVADFTRLADARGWNASTRKLAKQRWRAFINWCRENGYADADPLRGLRTPLPKARGVEVLPTDAEVATLLSAANERLRPVIEALIDTGCRPIEVFRVTADQFDAAAATWTLAKRKTARVRVVHLTPRVRDYCVAAAARWPTGPLYRLRKGAERDAASESTWLSWTFSVKRKRLGLRRGITPYSLRHSFATTALAIGESESVVAELLGNSVAVLRQHYNHLAGRPDALRDALRRIRGG